MFKRVWLSEWQRVFKRKKTIVGIVIYLLLVGLEALFLYAVGGVSFYNKDQDVLLNNLNTAPFFLRELGMFLVFILIPMFVSDSFNGEYTSGAYRLVLLRPQGRFMLFIAKLGVQAAIVVCLLAATWLIATAFGIVVFPSVQEVSFYNTIPLQPLQASIYVLAFYVIAFLVLFAVICVGSAISSIMPNSILSYVGTVGFLIGCTYLSEYFFIFFQVSDTIFEILSQQQLASLLLIVSLIAISYIINAQVWKKRDWLG